MPYLGMQVLIEGLALAAFGVHRDISNASTPPNSPPARRRSTPPSPRAPPSPSL
jgi:hypothetical protein